MATATGIARGERLLRGGIVDLDRAIGAQTASISVDRLDEDLDRAAAGQPDVPGHLVGDAVADQLRLAGAQHLLRLLEDGGLDAAAADRAGEIAGVGDGHRRADRARRGAFDLDDGGDRDLLPGGAPGVDLGQKVFHGSVLGSSVARRSLRSADVGRIDSLQRVPIRSVARQLGRRLTADDGALSRRTGG